MRVKKGLRKAKPRSASGRKSAGAPRTEPSPFPEIFPPDPASGLPLCVARAGRAAEELERRGAVGILAVRLVDALRVEAALGSGAFERRVRAAAAAVRESLAGAVEEPWELTVNGPGGDVLVAFVSRMKGDASVSEEALFRLKEAVRAASARDLALHAGCAIVYPQPSVHPRRLVYQGIERATANASVEETPEFERQNQELKRIIYQSHVRTVYQPIVEMETGAAFAYEALTRGPAETEFESPDFLFALSRRSGLLLEMDFLCRHAAVSSAGALPEGAKLFVNVLAHTLAHRRFLEPRFMNALERAGLAPSRIVFEVSEKYPISDYTEFRRNASELRRHGFALAVDDAGMGYSNLRTLYELEPEFVKMDHSLTRHIHAEPVHEKVFRVLSSLSEGLGATVIAEGVETEAEFTKLRAMGVRYGQGFYFSAPDVIGVPAA